MGKVNRTTLQSFYQNPGQVYDDTKTEGAINTLADQIDANDTEFQDLNTNVYRKTEIDTKINNAASTKTVAAGTGFPAGPFTDGQEFYRADQKTLYVYDSSTAAWVTVLPYASASQVGAVKVGTNLSINQVTGVLNAVGNALSASGGYTGDGTANRVINVGFRAKSLTIVSSAAIFGLAVDDGTSTLSVRGANSAVLAINATSFTINDSVLNTNGTSYKWGVTG